MHWCPVESEAVLLGAGISGYFLYWVKFRKEAIVRWLLIQQLAWHLHRCDHRCGYLKYYKLA